MVVTDVVLHELMSPLKVLLPSNSCAMSVMRRVSQFAMGPYVVVALVGSLTHRFTAVTRSALLVKDVGQEIEPGLWPPNIPLMLTLSESSQHRYWLKAVAMLNMLLMIVTELMFHELRSWLKTVAP